MNFEHLVEINDPLIPLLIQLTRSQLWAGLMHRVEDSRPFLPGLDECRILARSALGVDRLLRWGNHEIQDRVSFVAEHWVRFDTAPAANHGGGSLTIRIEEPEPGRLFLRFLYATAFATGQEAEDGAYAEFLRQAYEQADIDTVTTIRSLVAPAPAH